MTSLAEIIAFLAVGVVLAGLFGRLHFLLDLASHFRIQATTAVIASTVILISMKRRAAVATGIASALLLMTLVPFWLPTNSGDPAEYRLLALNVLTSNTQHKKVLRLLKEADPDFIVLQETDRQWITALGDELQTKWPYSKVVPRQDNFGIALWSKVDWESCDVVSFTDGIQFAAPSIDTEFRTADGKTFRLVSTHLLPPMSDEAWQIRNGSLNSLAAAVREGDQSTTIVTGDFNCTPWSPWFQQFVREAGLRNSAYGQGLAVTWRPFAFALAGLPIDHALVGDRIRIMKRTVSSNVGSDHRAIIVDFAILD